MKKFNLSVTTAADGAGGVADSLLDETKEDLAERVASATPSKVTDNVYLGNNRHAMGYERLRSAGVRRILNVRDECLYPPDDFVFEHVPLSDTGASDLLHENAEDLETCLSFIADAEKESEPVLVHCSLGVNRSPTVVIAYLMKALGWSLRRAFTHVKAVHPDSCPHELYIKQLQDMELEWLKPASGKPSLSLEETGPSLDEHMASGLGSGSGSGSGTGSAASGK